MKYGIIILIAFIAILVNCAKPVSLRSAPQKIEDDPNTRSVKDYPFNAKSGHCYIKTVVPAQYKTVNERVLVSEKTTKIEEVPAVIETVEEKVIEKPGISFWKKSSENDLYCYEEIPPVYKTVKKEIVKEKAFSREVTVEPEYKNVEKRVVASEERNEWTEVLCGNNARPAVIERLQRALKKRGYSPGRDDGLLDENTIEAINKFQKDSRLKVNTNGLIYMETAEALGVYL